MVTRAISLVGTAFVLVQRLADMLSLKKALLFIGRREKDVLPILFHPITIALGVYTFLNQRFSLCVS